MSTPANLLTLFLTCILSSGLIGCTKWSEHRRSGAPREVGRQLIGSPQIAETKSTSLSAGFAGGSRKNIHGGTNAVGALAGSSGSMKRTHCVQQARIDYVQDYTIGSETSGRWKDLTGGILLGLIGLSTISSTSREAEWNENYDSSGGYMTGYGLTLGGAGWLIYSYAALPGNKPAPRHEERRYAATEFVESSGCGLVPGDKGSPGPPADAVARLKKLESLHRSGMITDVEYQTKRKELLDRL